MKFLPLAAPLLLALTLPLAAQDSMTDAERTLFRDEVRTYLLENPEVLMEAIGVLEQRQAAAQTSSDAEMLQANAAAIFDDPASWVGGNPEGDITVVEFLDYRCSYCRKATAEVEELVKSDGNIRFIVKEYPILGAQSVLASRFAIAVLQLTDGETYKRTHDALMGLRGDVTPEALERLAGDLGIDAPAVMARMNSPEVQAVIDENQRLGGLLAISGTPTFVIDQTLLRGYVPLDGMREIVAGQRG